MVDRRLISMAEMLKAVTITVVIDGEPVEVTITSLPNININSMPNITIADIVSLNIDSLPNINIASIPNITIADIVNLNIDSIPVVTIQQQRIASTPAMNQVNVAAASVTILAANANRKQVLIRNQHTSGDVYIYFGATATLTNGMLLMNGETYQFPEGFTYTGVITAISVSATNKPVAYQEWS